MKTAFNPGQTIFLGASRGIGAALLSQFRKNWPNLAYQNFSRTSGAESAFWTKADFSIESQQDELLLNLQKIAPSTIIYSAGGGPFGPFGEKKWRDHNWALQVTQIFPAKLLHNLLNTPQTKLERFVCLGSSVAESKADPLAASYSMAKHALWGLHKSVAAENPPFDFRLFSPGYTDTSLLPSNAAVRRERIWSTKEVAEDFWNWIATGPRHDHRSLAIRPETL